MTTKELFEARKKELKDWQYGTVYKLYDREEECEVLASDVDRYFDDEFIKELDASIRKETLEEITKYARKEYLKIGVPAIAGDFLYEAIRNYALSKGITLQ